MKITCKRNLDADNLISLIASLSDRGVDVEDEFEVIHGLMDLGWSRQDAAAAAKEMVAGNAPIFVLMSYWSDPESGMGGDSFDIEGFFYGTSLDNEKKKLEVLKGTVPELAEQGNLYVEEYRPEYHGEIETVWPDLTSLVKQPADLPEDPYSDDNMWF